MKCVGITIIIHFTLNSFFFIVCLKLITNNLLKNNILKKDLSIKLVYHRIKTFVINTNVVSAINFHKHKTSLGIVLLIIFSDVTVEEKLIKLPVVFLN